MNKVDGEKKEGVSISIGVVFMSEKARGGNRGSFHRTELEGVSNYQCILVYP